MAKRYYLALLLVGMATIIGCEGSSPTQPTVNQNAARQEASDAQKQGIKKGAGMTGANNPGGRSAGKGPEGGFKQGE